MTQQHISDLEAALPLAAFTQALTGSYQDPESAARSHLAGHLEFFSSAAQRIQATADTAERLDMAARLLEGFQKAYLERVRSLLSSQSRFVSWHIAGPSRYPVGRMEKRSNVIRRKEQELLEWRGHRVRAIVRQITAVGHTPLTRLEEITAKLSACEAKQQHMKAVNAMLRKHRYEDTPALRAALEPHGVSAPQITAFLTPDFCNRRGYHAFEITNNSAQIRRWRAELTSEQNRLERSQHQPQTERTVGGVQLEEDNEANRLRLHFPMKPDSHTIANLKRHGWKWSPRCGAWQRILTNDARSSALHVIAAAQERQP